MTCRECRDLILEVARRRAPPFVERAVAAHADGCVECARRLAAERSLTAGLRALAGADAVPSSADLERRMATAFAALHGQRRQPDRPAGARSWLPMAAGLMLAAGLAAWWTTVSAPVVVPRSNGQTAVAVPFRAAPPPDSKAPGVIASHGAGADAGSTAVARESRSTTAARRPRSTAVVPRVSHPQPVEPAGFTPIPSAAGLPDFESGEIVRLDMPVASLPNYGVEMPADAPSSSIQADLLVGQDGQPRAIRLVTTISEEPRPRR